MTVSYTKQLPRVEKDKKCKQDNRQFLTQRHLGKDFLQATPLNRFDLRIVGCGLLVNIQDRDSLPTKDKFPAPKCVCYSEVPMYVVSHKPQLSLH